MKRINGGVISRRWIDAQFHEDLFQFQIVCRTGTQALHIKDLVLVHQMLAVMAIIAGRELLHMHHNPSSEVIDEGIFQLLPDFACKAEEENEHFIAHNEEGDQKWVLGDRSRKGDESCSRTRTRRPKSSQEGRPFHDESGVGAWLICSPAHTPPIVAFIEAIENESLFRRDYYTGYIVPHQIRER